MVEVPSKSQQEMKSYFEEIGEGLRWRNFRDCQKNPFLKKSKLRSQYYRCPVCKKPLKFGITSGHHTTYERICVTDERVKIDGIYMADCESCFGCHTSDFFECMHSIVYVHSRCHKKIHEV